MTSSLMQTVWPYILSIITVVLILATKADVYISTTSTNQTKTVYVGTAYADSFSTSNYVVAAFLGIPYAQPPTGSKRFTLPVLNAPSGGTFEALQLGSVCPQIVTAANPCIVGMASTMSEDCLFLNIFVPLPSLTSTDVQTGKTNLTLPVGKKYPVLFYVHGSGYYFGSGNCYDGTHLAGLGEVIVVSFNFRLGVLGFLTTGDDVIPGNLAIWDQLIALRWVNQNIEAFGGDPSKVTVGGHSAGGIFGTLLSIFPQDESDLFQRVIALSGSPILPKSIKTNVYSVALEIANDLGCNIQGDSRSADIKDCLMGIKWVNLTYAKTPTSTPLAFPLEASLAKPLVPTDPTDFMSQANAKYKSKTLSIPAIFYKKDLFMGISSEDGVVYYVLKRYILSNSLQNMTYFMEQYSKMVSFDDFKQFLYEFFAKSFADKVDDNKIEINACLDRYIPWESPDDLALQSRNLVKFLTDIGFAVPMADTALAHVLGPKVDSSSAAGKTYMYIFTKGKTGPEYSSLINWFEGTEHDADIPYFFGSVSDSADVALSKKLMMYFLNFIKTGDPNGAGLATWNQFDEYTQPYMYISTNLTEARKYFAASAQHFLNEFIPSLKETKNSGHTIGKFGILIFIPTISIALLTLYY